MQIHFCTSPKWGSRLIRWVTGEKYSHVAMQLSGSLSDIVVHSTFTAGVELETLEAFQKHSKIETTLCYRGLASTKLWETKALFLDGSAYDYLGFLLSGLRMGISRLIHRPIRDSIYPRNGRFICSEFVATVLGPDTETDITPGELRRKLLATGDWKESQ